MRKNVKTGSSLAAVTAAAIGCAPAAPPPPPAAGAPRVVQTSLEKVGLDPGALDRSADPCQDFYQFACGGWIASTEIPADKSRWVRSFSVIDERNEEALRQILEDARKGSSDPTLARIGAYYGACMDEKAVESLGTSPLKPILASIDRVKDRRSLNAAVAELHRRQVWVLFDVSADQDFKDATRVIAHVDQSGLGLPDRDYYLVDDERSNDIRAFYREHVEKMFGLAGWKAADARAAAGDVMRIETRLAELSMARVDRRDPYKIYHKIDRSGLAETARSFDWSAYFRALGVPDLQDVNVTSPDYIAGMDALLGAEKPKAWRSYLTWHVLRATADYLPAAFVAQDFALAQKLSGQAEIEPRWKRCVAETDAALGELLGQPFVAKHFSGDSKPEAVAMVKGISGAMASRLESLEWMEKETRANAEQKRRKMVFKIGYPDTWKTYDFEVRPDDLLGNVGRAAVFDLTRNLDKIGKPVDRGEWHMTPPTVNAYYNPSMNEMVFPAGILQPPFFDKDAAVAVNYGGMGMVVGHELTHGFDDEGSQFDGDGNLRNWWDEKTGRRFEAETRCVAAQYSKYEPVPGKTLNGELTLGENIADIGGVKLAFQAYREARKGAKETLVADGFTEDQLFFLGAGQAWCSKTRPDFAEMLIKVDPHSPPRFRINGSMANVPAFAEAFSCSKGTPMNPVSVCKVW